MTGWLPIFARPTFSAPPPVTVSSRFYGDPNVNATGAPSGGLVDSRTGDGLGNRTPFAVQVSIDDIVIPGYAAPWRSAFVSWNFNDPSGSNTVYDKRLDQMRNLNDCQIGPMASYIYRTAGVKTATATVMIVRNGVVETYTFTKSWTVAAFSDGGPTVHYFSYANGNDSWDGTSPTFTGGTTGPKQSMQEINWFINASNVEARLERGSVWPITSGHGIDFNQSAVTGVRMTAYGTGNNPKISLRNGANGQALQVNNGGGDTGIDKKDIFIEWIDFEQYDAAGVTSLVGIAPTADNQHHGILHAIFLANSDLNFIYDRNYSSTDAFTISIASNGTATVAGSTHNIGMGEDLLSDDGFIPQGIRFDTQLTGDGENGNHKYGDGTYSLYVGPGVTLPTVSARSGSSNKPTGLVCGFGGDIEHDLFNVGGLYNVKIRNSPNSKTIGIGCIGSPLNWAFDIGLYFEGAGTDSTFDHHRYTDGKLHQLFSFNWFGPTGAGRYQRNMCINGNWDGIYGDNTDHQFPRWVLMSQNYFANCIWAFDLGNRLNNSNPDDSTVQFIDTVIEWNALDNIMGNLFACGKEVTIRFNRQWGSSQFHGPYDGTQNAGYETRKNLKADIHGNRWDIPALPNSVFPNAPVINMPTAGWGSNAKLNLTDNVLRDRRGPGVGQGFIVAHFDDQAACGDLIDRNTVFAPNGGQIANDQTLGPRTWAQYRQLPGSPDANGNQNDPGWPTNPTKWSDLDLASDVVYPSVRNYVAVGDSITDSDRGHTAQGGGYAKAAARLAQPVIATFTNRGLSGAGINQLLEEASTTDALLQSGQANILSVFIGANDGPDATWLAKLAGYCDARRAAGWYVLLATLLPQYHAGNNGFNTLRGPANVELRKWTTSGSTVPGKHADAIFDFGGDAILGPDAAAADLTWFAGDGVHPTLLAQARMRDIFRPVLDGAQSNATTAPSITSVQSYTGEANTRDNVVRLVADRGVTWSIAGDAAIVMNSLSEIRINTATPGTYNTTITATDAQGRSSSRAFSWTVVLPPSGYGPNLLINGDAKQGIMGWLNANETLWFTGLDGDTIYMSAIDKAGGGKEFVIQGDGNGYPQIAQDVPIETGATYAVEGLLRWGDSSGAPALRADPDFFKLSDQSHSDTLISGTTTIVSGNTLTVLLFLFSAAESGHSYFSGLRVRKVL